MAKISSRDKISKNLQDQTAGVRWYFKLLPEIIDNVSSPEPALAYCFQRIETAQRVGLYVMLMREYRTDSKLAWKAVDKIDITRKNFPEFYERICGHSLPVNLREIIEPAEKVRDNITHGREESKASIHGAILNCLKFVEALNETFFNDLKFRPVGPLKGVTGIKGKPQLDARISRVILKGLGFPL